MVKFCGHVTKPLSSDVFRDILGLISLNYVLICEAVNACIDEDITFVFRGAPYCISCRRCNARDVIDSKNISFAYLGIALGFLMFLIVHNFEF